MRAFVRYGTNVALRQDANEIRLKLTEEFFEEGESNQAARANASSSPLLAHLMRGCGSPGEIGAWLHARL
jgi:hypothetical protein